MSTEADSFSAYLDHLILLLAARFHAPLELSVDELLPSAAQSPATAQSPWELVAKAVQQALCTPQTPQERRSVRQLDPHHFTAAVCRERTGYLQWKLQETRRHRRAARATESHPAVATPPNASGPGAAAAPAVKEQPYDVTRDSLHNDVLTLYALVRQSLPSTLGGADSDSDADDDVAGAAPPPSAAAAESIFSGVQDVHVRTPAECERDAQVARARDEFLSQVQALQSVYYDKYRRWMDVPASVLDPPPPQPAQSSASTAPAPAQDAEEERAALLAALGGAAAPPSSQQVAPVLSRRSSGPAARAGVPPAAAVATVLRQVRLQRPLRPSAVSDEALESMYHTQAASSPDAAIVGAPVQRPQQRLGGASLARGGASAPSAAPSHASSVARAPSSASSTAAADASCTEAADAAASVTPTPPTATIRKDTAPPASRRGRWQIVEYDAADDGDDEE